jgi:taurine dioxygenase
MTRSAAAYYASKKIRMNVIAPALVRFEVPAVVANQYSIRDDCAIAFSRRFGPLEIQSNSQYSVPGHPEVLVISNDLEDGKPVGLIDAGDYWHTDSQSRAIPSRATILHSIKNPSQGGDTLFANMYAAYETLPDDIKSKITGLHGVNASSKLKNPRVVISKRRPDADEFYASRLDKPDALHPIVRTHPITRRKALYLSPRFTIAIAELPGDEGQQLLDLLFEHQMKPEFRYVHKWRKGDLVMWDNRCLLHCASGGYAYPDVRRMHRTVIAGEKPE